MTETPARYRHRTDEIEAVQWTGHNADELHAFAGSDFDEIDLDDRIEDPEQSAAVREADHGTWRGLKPGDWVVRLDGGLYEFSAADFAKQYEPVGSAPATTRDALVEIAAQAIRDAACPGNCGKTEEECARDRIQPFVWHHGRLAVVEGTPEMFADAVLSVLPASSDRADEVEAHRLALSTALSLGTSAPWDAIRERATELAADRSGWRAAAVFVEAMNEGCGRAKPCASCDAREDAAAELRRVADETPQEAPWLSDSARIGRALIWSWSDIGKGERGEGYRAAQVEVRALLTGQRNSDEAQPAKEPVWCGAVALRVHHTDHDWTPQPGMDPVHCVGYPQPKEA